MASQHFGKRARTESSSETKEQPSPAKWVAFLPVDSAEPVMCNLSVLEPARPALFLQATRDEPCAHTQDGIPCHRTGFTKAQLAAFVSSFYVQRLMVTKSVALDELVGMFEQQGVTFSWNNWLPSDEQTNPSGIAVARLTSTASASIREACNTLAYGLCYWNRLELCMDAALGSHLRPLPDSIELTHFAGFDCTATRAWIRFQNRPADAKKGYSEGTCLSLVSEWPFWLDRMLRYLSVVFAEAKLSGYTESTFSQMEAAAHNTPLHHLWWLAKDGPRSLRKACASGAATQQFTTFVKSRLTDSNYTVVAPYQPVLPGFQTRNRAQTNRSEELQFARACVNFCLKSVKEAVEYSSLFSGACADDDGLTPERREFAKACEPLGIKVKKWSDDDQLPRKPIMFPPYCREVAQKDGPAVLLEFMNR
jgi:hypothetical protein